MPRSPSTGLGRALTSTLVLAPKQLASYVDMLLDLSGRTAIITGASRGIGAAIARTLAAEGVEVALLARSAPLLNELASELTTTYGRTAVPIPVDLRDPVSVLAAVDRARDCLGRIDILVNNAGASAFGDFDALGDEEWQSAFELKLMGYVRCMRAVLPEMRIRKSGRIVNVVGMGGRFATAGYVLGAFNAALLHVTKSVGDLVADDGVVVVAVNPGMTMTKRIGEPSADQIAAVPIGRAASTDEIARIVAVLCTEVGALACGSAFQADGGAARGAF